MKIEDIAKIDESTATFSARRNLPLNLDMGEAGKILASYSGQLSIEDWLKLPEEFLKSLVKHNGAGISFLDIVGGGGLELTVEKAKILSTYNGNLNIDTPRLNFEQRHPRLDPRSRKNDLNPQDGQDEILIAKALSLHKGGVLGLTSLTELSIEAARELLKHELPVYLDQLVDDEDSSDFNPEIAKLYAETSKRWSPEFDKP